MTIRTVFDTWGVNTSQDQILGVFGWIDASLSVCERDRKVTLFKKRPKKKDKRIASTKTGASLPNRFEINKVLKPGRYYLRVKEKELRPGVVCSQARSKTLRLKVN